MDFLKNALMDTGSKIAKKEATNILENLKQHFKERDWKALLQDLYQCWEIKDVILGLAGIESHLEKEEPKDVVKKVSSKMDPIELGKTLLNSVLLVKSATTENKEEAKGSMLDKFSLKELGEQLKNINGILNKK
uniref:HEAT repeat domain-containing protein n=1 Tax=Parastrongyloides trichosuri TaxID=131310 RepID=A0A0N4ZJG7_PARTI